MTDTRLERILALVLIAGVVGSALLVSAGYVAALAVGWEGTPSDFGGLADRLLELRPLALLQAGILLLIATPVFRVAVSVFGFAAEHDRLYVTLSAVVLVLLLVSLALLR